MTDNQNQPRDYDAVLGGQSPPPVDGIVLGGIEGIKRCLSNPVANVRIAALSEALKYGDAGLDVVRQALQDKSKLVRRFAYRLLKQRVEPQVIQALQTYKPWNLEERFEKYQESDITQFANRQVVDFEKNIGIVEPVNKAYALRYEYDNEEDLPSQISRLLQEPNAEKLEALVFGLWAETYERDSSEIVQTLVDAKKYLTNLKAVFIGDIAYDECEISWIQQSDISPILQAYPKLEILQVRGGDGLHFSPPVRHNSLKALIVETGGLSRDTVAQICNMNLPALEHLELWFGSEDYGGDCWVEDIHPILFQDKFPNLTYLGLRNSQFTDEIANAIVASPIINSISVLDLSMGTLSDAGAEELLNCEAINYLDILNVSESFLSQEMIEKLSGLDVRVLASNQKHEDDNSYINSRYCSVAE
ncbi:MAG: HEAT repeat domain-containing protein [Nostoc sp. GBBB01]|uniref:STM4015 family protein n=1 Tax=Nostoc punctiforme FACHB-252 TaxID=1357509 RepID=A0ABR8HD64_NOSPU|nr:STM4015 family protein [Nostoc punctiforme]MBD2613616.1 STM4015 family protein [Nostoc punctiforme FACHB-252]MBL1199720.1 HEAT repeat domain-containing protein [Nostoc sp. GBBB01]